MGSVFISLDYNAPLEAIREEFMRLMETTELWDKRVAVVQVTDATENTIQIRMLVSAYNSSRAFDLRCFIRENMIRFVQQNYPEALPVKRNVVAGGQLATFKDNEQPSA